MSRTYQPKRRICSRMSILPNRRGTEMLDSSSWTWGLGLIVLTTAIHSLGIVLMAIAGLRIHAGLERRRVAFWRGVAIVTGLIAAIGLLLAVLHGIEAALWAAAYLGLGALDNAAEAMLFSIDSMTTRGASGLALHQHWQVMGALESVAGMLMFGISTAYVFAVMQQYWPMLQALRQH
jgi:hypothetical protein